MSIQIFPHPTQLRHFAAPTSRLASGKWLTVLVVLAGFTAGVFGSLTPAKAAQSQQHSWVGDVPIMADLSVEPALGFAFDSPNGRIVMIFASSTAKAADILGFYNDSLPAIGWVGGDGTWRRGLETLVISEVSTAAGQLWRLMVRPN
jgi:hypothetical protein